MAVDYTRHALELSQRSVEELAGSFNMELSRAVRFEPKRSIAVEQILAMHKRHGEAVLSVLKEVIREQAEPLARGTVEKSSLLALVLNGGKIAQAAATTPMRKGLDWTSAEMKRYVRVAGEVVEERLQAVMAKFGDRKRRTPKKTTLQKRDAVIFAAIILGRAGTGYCAFLHEHGIRPKWGDGDSSTDSYPRSYKTGDPWRKKVQDEKTRAKLRMNHYNESELADAFSAFLPGQLEELRQKLAVMSRR